MSSGAIHWVPYADDPLAVTAARLLARCQAHLPDLDSVVVLLAERQAGARLRQHLQTLAEQRGYSALLGPHIDTLRGWVEAQPRNGAGVLSTAARELMLVEALQDNSSLLGAASPWRLAENLLELFDELTLHRIDLSDALETLLERLRRGYRIAGDTPAALSQEARLVHTLWHAYHIQSGAEHVMDPQAAYLLRLDALRKHPDPAHYIYLVGSDTLCPAEAHWCRELLAHGHGELILHGPAAAARSNAPLQNLALALNAATEQTTTAGAFSACLDTCFQDDGAPFAERARTFAATTPSSPLHERLSIFTADGAEQEAAAIDIQVRRWLLEGKQRVAIVTEDRRLARRVRALLERAGLILQDSAGWALSTTRAAATLERWLETVEDDFAQQPLLDLLKSPLLFQDQQRDSILRTVQHFEIDIVRHANIARGLHRYRRELDYRHHQLPHWTLEMTQQLTALLENLAHAAAPLQRHLDGRAYAPEDFLLALQESLHRLGLDQSLSTDPAGNRVLEELAHMRAALPGRRLRMSWDEFRAWLGRKLEQHNFLPPGGHGPVQLLNLAQSRLLRSDALIIAGADRAHLPGDCAQSPFFNQGVRSELNLPTWRDTLALRLHHFRRLLESAPQILITLCDEQDGEAIAPCPWVDALRTFHRLAYGSDLGNATLAALTQDPRAQVSECDTPDTPAPHVRPRPVLREKLLPHTLTVSAHQRLIDCPYAFYAADCLHLKTPDEIRETLDKSDYGQRVHKCLQAFHGGLTDLPGPFPEPLGAHNRAAGLEMLNAVSAAVFAKDLEDNFEHRGWLQRWRQLIPGYIDWQIERNRQWRVQAVEHSEKRALSERLTLKGRLDRIDNSAAGIGIIDYKTGAVRRQEDVDNGEDVQLCSYALLLDGVARVEYLQLDAGRVQVKAQLESAALTQLAQSVGDRLRNVTNELRDGTAMPAWGDAATCARCDLEGVCRRESWETDAAQEC